ncbi:MAG: methyl-accepting chemotaxis protein [Clostridia bacterium]
MKKRINLTLGWKIMGTCVLLILCSSLILGYLSLNRARTAIEDSVSSTALAITKSMVNMIDTEKFSTLQSEEDMEEKYYIELRTSLNDIREATGLKYLYTMIKTADNKYIYVVDGTPMDDAEASLLGDEEKSEDLSNIMKASFEGQEGYELNWTEAWGNLVSAYVPIKNQSGKMIGIVGADFDANDIVNELNNLKVSIAILVILIIIIGILISGILSILLVRSVKKLKAQVELVKQGDLTVVIEDNSSDEIGMLSQAFRGMVSSLTTITKDIRQKTKNIFSDITFLNESFHETSKATEEITQVINEIASGSLEQVQGVEDVSQSMNQVFEQVTKAVEYANSVYSSSNKSVSNTEYVIKTFKTSMQKVNTVNDMVEDTSTIIQHVSEKSREIASFSDTISQIASQTNLLALNAAIEAARAGENGKGFAVVADEVRTLAEQSNLASKQIDDIIKNMQSEISKAIQTIQGGLVQARDGVNAVNEVNNHLNELKQSSADAYSRVEEIINAIRGIENDCRSALSKIHEMADVSRSFSAGSQQAAASTEEQSAIIQQIEEYLRSIRQDTQALNTAVDKFKIE